MSLRKNNDNNNDISTVIIQGISVSIVFFIAVALIIVAMFMFNTKGEFVKALDGEIKLSISFYVSAVAVIFVSSIMFTPFSFGISNFFINSKAGNGHFSQIFYLFKNPKLMFKAIMMNTLKNLIINFQRILTLIVAVLAECGLFVISIAISGENIFDYEQNFLESVAEFITHDTFFIVLTIIEWCIVLIIFIVLKMRYIMCKYALIRFPALKTVEAIRVGEFSIRDKIFKTMLFYIKYISIYIFTFITMGLSKAIINNKNRDSFSTYAVRVVENGIEAYYMKRSY